jgi:cell division protein FtsB
MELTMKSQKTYITTLAALALLVISLALWSGVVQAQDQIQTQVQIYGSQLMTATERSEYQTKMRALKSDSERDAFRLEHHEKMKTRALEKGVTLPNSPPAAGAATKGNSGIGVGPGSGMGKGLQHR